MYQAKELTVSTRGRGLVDITGEVQKAVKGTGIREGLCTVFLHHTSASLIIGENADPVVQRDLEAFFSRLVKDGDPLFQHDAEGPDDMPAHVRTVLTQLSLSIPVKDGEADLGTWQGVYVWEHRTSPHRRRVTVSVLGG
ncbi:YjbQ family protein [Corallococcus sp. AB004]|uniref:secondary thiamine-phosphate synthase enzyme YjbQ n=1 Tax=Corallococcus TaxID=83461 RepID=UPI000EA15598|nr:secondary thiamine-phosphate synthase enzyme YjbQ [Corallococcus sp. AB038B]NPC72237.1 YjbQ family protein [Corallococcus exiguus]RKH50852.1 YjbQ family protein [Corallococcus sp. AB050B]RKI43046.1 YjbQ family protein [Corallococcus sp. AB004]NPD25888.1 YjbQ family protein [Corallococcus exiguus]NRD45761.1 YjbQ family protein [Corallococcus exiguus]